MSKNTFHTTRQTTLNSFGSRRRRLGIVVEVTTEKFQVEMAESTDGYTLVGFDDQHYVARIGTLVLIPLSSAYIVSEVVGLQERPQVGMTHGGARVTGDVGNSSLRELTLKPLGTLPFDERSNFTFGVSEFPPLYADVLHVENRDLDRILNVENHEVNIPGADPVATRFESLSIGASVVFSSYDVKIRVDDFFGGHSAVLGNTGSGKSCTISSILQEVLGKKSLAPAGGSTFVVLDTNGEYRRAVSNLPSPIKRIYSKIAVPGLNNREPSYPIFGDESVNNFRLPHWLLTTEEWELLLQASDRVQRPVLRNALGLTSLFSQSDQNQLESLRNHILASCILQILNDSENPTAAASRIHALLHSFPFRDESTTNRIHERLKIEYGSFKDANHQAIQDTLRGMLMPSMVIPDYKNLPFEFAVLEDALEMAVLYEEAHGNKRVRDNCSTLLTRLKTLKSRTEFDFLRVSVEDGPGERFDGFVNFLIGIESRDSRRKKSSQIHILDLSNVDDEIVEVVSSVVTRLVFDRLRECDPRNSMPVTLVLEEAHRYVPNRQTKSSALDATRVFERVAKEGREYGLFLMLSSQRPSELSGTVLSQCSNYLVHRIQNPEDLLHLRRLTPYISESVMSRVASLPKQQALIFGTAVNIPMTLRVRDADPLPESDDSRISQLWYRNPGFDI